MLVLSRKLNESIVIDGTIEVVITEISKDSVKLAIVAPRNIQILRKELIASVIETNKEATVALDPSQLLAMMKQRKGGQHNE